MRWLAEFDVAGVLRSLGQRALPAIPATQVERVLRAAAVQDAAPA